MIDVLRALGGNVQWVGHNRIQVEITNPTIFEAPYDLVRQMRASFWVMGPLLERLGKASVPIPVG